MANKEQVALLKEDVGFWNKWRFKYSNIDLSNAKLGNADLSHADLSHADLSHADLVGADLSHADLREADLSKANLYGANLSKANLYGANLSKAHLREANLTGANLSKAHLSVAYLYGANLSKAHLREANFSGAYGVNLNHANLSGANLSKIDLSDANLIRADLSDADLSDADLSGADLSGANLSSADLSNANLSNANLSGAQVLNTNLTEVNLTGACIRNWQIGSSTILEGVKCDYIFRTYDTEKYQFSGRLPIDFDSTFVPGEFIKLFQILESAYETIPITFSAGIDWQAFFQSFQALRESHPDEEISIQGLERKGDAFIVRLEVAAEADKGAIETEVKQLLAALEARYQEQLRLQSEEIATYRQTQSSLLHIVQTMAEKDAISQTFNAPVGNVAGTNHGKMQNIQHIYAPEQKDLSEAAKEIQKLLNTLAETYNTTTETGQAKLMRELGEEIEKHPKWRRALKEGGIELIKVLCAPIGVPLEMARVYLEDDE